MNKKKNKNIVVLVSGGLDSSTLAYLVAKGTKPYSKNRVYILTFDYGQRHKKELSGAYRIAKNINAVEQKVVKCDLTLWKGSSLTDSGKKIPKNGAVLQGLLKSKKLINKSIPSTYVPARNTLFLSFALSYAEAISAEEIYIGVNAVDYSGYVDCRPEFIKKFQELVKVATVCGVRGRPIKVKTPLMKMSKGDIVRLGNRLGVDWKSTWSCYSGEEKASGLCDSCQLRLKGFMQADTIDPIDYQRYPVFYGRWLSKKL